MTNEIRATLLEAVRYFAVPAHCNDFMREIKWPGGMERRSVSGDQLSKM